MTDHPISPDQLDGLAERAEAAKAYQQGAMLCDVAVAVSRPGEFLFERMMVLLAVDAFEPAAMTLVPEGWEWFVGNCGGQASASVNPAAQPFPAHLDIEVDATTPALALTAACLRARAAALREAASKARADGGES